VPEKLIIRVLNLFGASLALIVPSMGIVWHLLSLEKVQANEWINGTHFRGHKTQYRVTDNTNGSQNNSILGSRT
jgi:hypothetical protein